MTIISKTDFDRNIRITYLGGMTLKKALIAAGVLLILAALLVTGTTYKEHGSISNDIMIASGVALAIGLALMIFGGKKNS